MTMEVDQTRAVSSFSSGKDGKGKSKGKGKTKDGKDTGKGKKGEKSKDQKPQAKTKQFQGYCGYCERWGHKRADCRKRIADGKSKGGAAAACADNDGNVSAVMDDDVQQNDLPISGQTTVPLLVGPSGGKHAMEATATFRVAEVRDNILSMGSWCERVSTSLWVLAVAQWRETGGACRSNWNETACVLKLMCCNVLRDLDAWRLDQL